MAASFSPYDIALWPTLGQTTAELAHHEILNRETLGAGTFVRTLDRANGMESTGPPTITQSIYGGIVAGNFLDTLNAGSIGPRDAVTQNFDFQRGLLAVHTGNGLLVDSIA